MHRYPGIALFVRIVTGLSWAVAALAAIGGLAALIGGFSRGAGFSGFLGALSVWIVGLLWFAGLKVLPEVLQILVEIRDAVVTRSGGPPASDSPQ